MKKFDQSYLNWGLSALIVLVFLMGVPYAFHRDPLPFAVNFLTYMILVIGVGMVVPAFLGFFWRYFGVQGLDDRFGHEDENIPESLHFWVGLISSILTGCFWAKVVIPFIARASALNLWAWELIRFRTIWEGYTSWGWVAWVLFLFAVGYFVAHNTEYDKYRRNR